MADSMCVNWKKCMRKQKRAQHRLARDMNIKCSDEPTENLVICNAGLVTGFEKKVLDEMLNEITSDYEIVMPMEKSYCFVKFSEKSLAEKVYHRVHGRTLCEKNPPLYLTFSHSIPNIEDKILSNDQMPAGLKLIKDFITPDEEFQLLNTINWDEENDMLSELKHRKVKHYGYKFCYGKNTVDLDKPIAPIPQYYKFLQQLFNQNECGNYIYDQLTINHYLSGQGIPPHIDTHSVFEDPILSLSLGSSCVMDFRKGDTKISIQLPARSLLIISGESRYAWTHGISPRHFDLIKTEDGITTQQRKTRISFTFRKTRRDECRCEFNVYCDSQRNEESVEQALAPQLEHCYVHDVYEEISNHFDETRYKQWPNVAKFLETIELGDILLDVGCGNGKYMFNQPGIFKIGCDRSSGLARICRNKLSEVLLSDCLHLPFKSKSVDAIISIAVIHHLSTPKRRYNAFIELLRVLRPSGRCLVYVWAKEQRRNSKNSTYLRLNPRRNINYNYNNETNRNKYEKLFNGAILPIHENRTNFIHNDVLVPWKRKDGGEFLRYYHVFEEDEFGRLCESLPGCQVETIYYDQGNWCTILQKK